MSDDVRTPARPTVSPADPGAPAVDGRPSALGGYEDWPAWVRRRPTLAGDEVTRTAAQGLGVRAPDPADPTAVPVPQVRAMRRWTSDGVRVEQLRWWVGFGPHTTGWVLRPDHGAGRSTDPLPGVLLLHCHAGVKSIGAERLLRTPEPTPTAERLRDELYAGRALAEDLARQGHVVLTHDTFAWGSRRFDLDPLPVGLRDPVRLAGLAWAADGVVPDAEQRYDAAAAPHEHVVAKAAGMLGTSFAGVVAHDDLVATAVLRSLAGVDPARTAAVGFSGGGGRAVNLVALDPGLRAAAVVAMMTTTDALLPAHADAHSWLLTTPGLLGRHGLPETAAGRLRHHLLSVAFQDDPLFPADGVRAAHEELDERFAAPGATGTFQGVVLPGGHVFSPAAQDRVAGFLQRALGA